MTRFAAMLPPIPIGTIFNDYKTLRLYNATLYMPGNGYGPVKTRS
jgi:hypothetical protein